MAERREPGRAIGTGIGAKKLGKHAPNNVLVNLDTESQGKLLRNSATAPACIAFFDFNDCLDEFRRRSLGPRFSASFRRKQASILTFHQGCMESEEGGRLQHDRRPGQPAGTNEERGQACDKAIYRS